MDLYLKNILYYLDLINFVQNIFLGAYVKGKSGRVYTSRLFSKYLNDIAGPAIYNASQNAKTSVMPFNGIFLEPILKYIRDVYNLN